MKNYRESMEKVIEAMKNAPVTTADPATIEAAHHADAMTAAAARYASIITDVYMTMTGNFDMTDADAVATLAVRWSEAADAAAAVRDLAAADPAISAPILSTACVEAEARRAEAEKTAYAVATLAAIVADIDPTPADAVKEFMEADSDTLTIICRRALTMTQDARALLDASATRSEYLTARIDRVGATRSAIMHGKSVVVACRIKTDEDFAVEAAKKLLDALTDADAPAAEKTAARRALTAAKTEARRAAAALTAADRWAGTFVDAAAVESLTANSRYGRPLSAVHAIIDDAAAAVRTMCGKNTVVVGAWYDLTAAADPDARAAIMTAAAAVVTKTTTRNCVLFQGTARQWSMYYAARAGRYDDADLADMVCECVESYALIARAIDDPAAVVTDAMEARAARRLAARLNSIPEADADARAMTADAAAVYFRDNDADLAARYALTDPAAVARYADADLAAIRSAVSVLNAADPDARAEAVHNMTRAAYNRINSYLSHRRSIHIPTRAADMSMENVKYAADYDAAARLDPDARAEAKARAARRAAVRAVYPDFVASLTPTMRATLNKLMRYDGHAATTAAAMGKNEKTVRECRRALEARFVSVVNDAAARLDPDARRAAADAADLAAAIGVMYDARDIDILTARAADLAARRNAADLAAAIDEANRAIRVLVNADAAILTAADLAAIITDAAAVVDSDRYEARRAAMRNEARAAMRDAVDSMPPAMRDAAALVSSGYSIRAAADKMGKHHSTVAEAVRAASRRMYDAVIEFIPSESVRAAAEARNAADLAALVAMVVAV